MGEKSLKHTVASSLLWKFLEVCGTSGISLIISIIVARFLLPEDYGIIAIVAVLLALIGTIITGGFTTALIQKKEISDADYSSVFYLTLGLATILYIVMFFGSPYLAEFYNLPLITPVFRILGLSIFAGAINSIQRAVLSRNFLFKKMFWNNFVLIILSGVVGIVLAYLGFGVWALVAQSMISTIGLTILMWITVKWRPKILFSISNIKGLFSYGWKIMVSNLLYQGYSNVSALLIGKVYSPADLGNYKKGDEIPRTATATINSTLQAVMFPAFAKNQTNFPAVKNILRRTIVTSGFLVFPAMIGLAIVAEPLVSVILTDKWLGAVPFIQIACIGCLFYPMHTTNSVAINAIGKSGLTLRVEIIKWILALGLILVTGSISVLAIAIGLKVIVMFATYLLTHINKRLISYGWLEQWKDMFPTLLLALIMGVSIIPIQFLPLPTIFTLILQIIIGIIVYFGLAKLFKLESLIYVVATIKEMMHMNK